MKRLWILAVIALLAAGFLLVSFRLISSQTVANSGVSSSRSVDQAGKNIPLSAISFSVSADGRLQRAVERALARQAGMTLLPEPADQASGPLLAVEVKEQDVFWTPFYARSALSFAIYYSTAGDVSFRRTNTMSLDLAGDEVLLVNGQFDLADTSWGVMTMPGYQDFLAEQVAAHVIKSLQDEANR